MKNILSLAIKNNDIQFIEFLPRIDFGLFNFDIGNDPLGATRFIRERADVDAQIDEPKPATQVDPLSGLHLDDLVIPDGIGVLERISYGNRKKDDSQVAVFSYFFFDRHPTHFFPDSNPRYPLYDYLALRKSFPYTGRYKTIVPAAAYFVEASYEPAESSRQSSYAANYPLIHKALFSQFDPKIYNKSNLFAPRLVSTDFFYGNNAQFFSTIAKQSTIEKFKPVEIATTIPKLLYPYTLLDRQAPADLPESEIDVLANTISKTPTQIEGTKLTPKTSFEIRGANPVPQSPATLEANVRNIYRLKSTPLHEIYGANPRHQIQIYLPHNPIQQAQTSESKIESRVRIFFAGRTYQGHHTREADSQDQSYGKTSSKNTAKPKSAQYAGINQQQNPRYKAGIPAIPKIHGVQLSPKQAQQNLPYNNASHTSKYYDMPSGWVNVMGSDVWKRNSLPYIRETKYTEPEQQHPESREDGTRTKPVKEEVKQRTDDEALAEEKKPKPDYEANKANQADNQENQSEKNINLNHQPNKKTKAKGRSILSYLGVAAGVGLLGLATLASPLLDRPKETEKPSLYAVYNNKTEESQKFTNPTIDSVVEPAQNNEKFFTQEFRENIESIIHRAYQMGYEDASISIRNNKTGEYYSLGNVKTRKPMPSSVKVAIGFAASYLAQKGLLDLGKKIDFDPDADKELVLQRELGEYTQFKNKNNFDYDELRRLMLRDSVNTATNLILKFIGNGDVYEGMRKVNQVMGEVGLNNTRVEVPYNRTTEYTRNQATTEENEKLMGYILQGKHLRAEDLASLREDLENERWMHAFRSMLPGINSGTKVTIYKNGIGFAAYLGDYSVSAMFNHSKEELYTDLARSAAHIFQNAQVANPEERITNQIYADSNIAIGDLFKTFRKYLFFQSKKNT